MPNFAQLQDAYARGVKKDKEYRLACAEFARSFATGFGQHLQAPPGRVSIRDATLDVGGYDFTLAVNVGEIVPIDLIVLVQPDKYELEIPDLSMRVAIDRNALVASCENTYLKLSKIIADWCENNVEYFVQGKEYPRLFSEA